MKQNNELSQISRLLTIALAVTCFIALPACEKATGKTDQPRAVSAQIEPLIIDVKDYQLLTGNEGRAVVQVDGYFIDMNFEYDDIRFISNHKADIHIDSVRFISVYDQNFEIYSEDAIAPHFTALIVKALERHISEVNS